MKKDIPLSPCPVCGSMAYSYKRVMPWPLTYVIGCSDFWQVESKKSHKHAAALWNLAVLNATADKRKAAEE